MAGALVTTNILNTMAAMGLASLREKIVMPRIVNRDYEESITGAKRNATVNVTIPAAVTARTVAPDVVPPAVTAVTPTVKAITLDQWYEAPFAMDDKGLAQVQQGIVPMQIGEAVKAIANNIDNYLWGLTHGAYGFYGYAGTAGTTPLATTTADFLSASKVASDQLMDDEPRFMLIDTALEANARGLRAFADASYSGGTETIIKGTIGEKLGANWVRTQNVPTHSNTGAGTVLVNDASVSVGDTTLTWDGGGTAPAAGDIFTVAGDTQTYCVVSSTATVITMNPAAKVAWADNAAVTFKADHVVNVLMHRDAIAFAMAPLIDTVQMPGASFQGVAIDENSGLSLRVEVTRQHRQWQWSYDALYGASVIRQELGVRLAG
tara:strand:- start:3344 stop:4477 length:1134 start_codon:yes stop_codon:yes gene_type:complete